MIEDDDLRTWKMNKESFIQNFQQMLDLGFTYVF
jgi:hypothetical protein